MEVLEGSFHLTPSELKAIVAFANTDPDKPALSAVFVEPSRGRVWAADAVRAVTCQGRTDYVGAPLKTVAVPVDACKRAIAVAKPRQHTVVLTVGRVYTEAVRERGPVAPAAPDAPPGAVGVPEDQCSLSVIETETGDTIGGTYAKALPIDALDLDAVLATRGVTGSSHSGYVAGAFGVNAALLADVKLVAQAAGGSSVEVWTPQKADQAVVLRTIALEGDTEWTAVLMPCDPHAERKEAAKAKAAQQAAEAEAAAQRAKAAVKKATVVVRTKGKPATEKAAKAAPAPAPAKGKTPKAKTPRKPRKSRSQKGASK